MKEDFDFYDLLGVDEDATEEEIREGFREQVRKYHPDLNDDPRAPAQFSALKKAYDTLADSKERDAYDRMGHDEYVSNRISGLPSPEAWIDDDETVRDTGSEEGADADDTGSDATGSAGGPATSTSASGSTRTTTGSAGGDGSGGSNRSRTSGTSRTSTSSTSRSDRGGNGRSSTGGSAVSETAGANGTRERSRSTGGVGNGRRSGGTGAGTARGPGAGTVGGKAEDDGTARGGRDGDADEDERTSVASRLRARTESTLAAVMGWPLVLAADALFLVSLGLYASSNAAGFSTLVDRLAAAGADPSGIQSALETQPQGFESLSSFVGSELNASPITGTLVLVGMAFLPSVYFFMVRWTRKNRLPWQPSYLYVVGSLSPIAALVASMVADVPGVYAEVFGFVAVPVATILAMLFFAQVKPRMARVYRRWRYKLGS